MNAIKTIFTLPIFYVVAVIVIVASSAFGSCEVVLRYTLANWDGGIPVIEGNLIWSVGGLVISILDPIIGYLIDKLGPTKMVLAGISIYAILCPFYYLIARTLPGLGVVIGITFALEGITQISLYPLGASIVDAIEIPNAFAVAFSLIEVLNQCGFAIGYQLGPILDDWGGLKSLGITYGCSAAVSFTISAIILFRTYQVNTVNA